MTMLCLTGDPLGDMMPFSFETTTILPGDQHYEDVYPQGNRHLTRLLLSGEPYPRGPGPAAADWRSKPVSEWSGVDVHAWIVETAAAYGVDSTELALFEFVDVAGADLLRMSRQTFCDKMHSDVNPHESRCFADHLYDCLLGRVRVDEDGEAVVPDTVDDYGHYGGSDYEVLDMDTVCVPPSAPDCRQPHCDSGYNSFGEENDPKPPTVAVKRPPGRPKGSGKKHPKRMKNVSVPEFLRDLLHSPKHCPRIIKWEDYSLGKFRFVNPNEVAKLWGSKRNNERMSFEKFSRAMRYHYKQGVLVSVPTARLVYQFGPKAPQYTTLDPNFETTVR